MNFKLPNYLTETSKFKSPFNGENPFSYPTEQSYIPVFCVKPLTALRSDVSNQIPYEENEKPGRGKLIESTRFLTNMSSYLTTNKTLSFNTIKDYLRDVNGIKIENIRELDTFLQKFNLKLNEYLLNPDISKEYLNPVYNTNGYSNLFELNARYLGWTSTKVSSKEYLSNFRALFRVESPQKRDLIPMYCLMISREFLEYYKLCLITGINPDPKIFEFWVNPELDTPRTKFKGLRTQYRGNVKKDMENMGIPIIEVDDLLPKIFNLISIPNFSTIKEGREYKSEISSEFLENCRIKSNLEKNKIKLII